MNPKNPENPVHPVKTSTHTPGPWIVTPNGYDIRAAALPDKAHAVAMALANHSENYAANARLIAAAADLLAALETLVEHFEESHAPELESDHQGDGPHGCTYCESIATARAAIAKAQGEG